MLRRKQRLRLQLTGTPNGSHRIRRAAYVPETIVRSILWQVSTSIGSSVPHHIDFSGGGPHRSNRLPLLRERENSRRKAIHSSDLARRPGPSALCLKILLRRNSGAGGLPREQPRSSSGYEELLIRGHELSLFLASLTIERRTVAAHHPLQVGGSDATPKAKLESAAYGTNQSATIRKFNDFQQAGGHLSH